MSNEGQEVEDTSEELCWKVLGVKSDYEVLVLD